jgi:pimeloyl-ACP methyl ester carboxylesterase
VSPAQGRLAAQRVPGARLVAWPDAGHQLIDDRGDDFDALLLEHLSRA